MFKMIDYFFTPDECDRISKTVKDNENLWYQCPHTNMYILGNSLFRKIEFTDNGLEFGTYFEDGYFDTDAIDLLISKLNKYYGRIEFITGFSRPGFQIIKLNEDKKPSVWHYDNMITCFPFERYFKDYDGNFEEYFEEKLIFTTILTDGEFSFDYYPETLSKFGKDFYESSSIKPICESHANLVGDECTNPNCELKEFKTVKYRKGSMLLQKERILHRVGMKDLNGTDSLRITLQCYGVVKNDVLYLLW